MTTALILLALSVGSVEAQDVEAGAAVFKKCAACHAADAVTNKIGPHLAGVLGRGAAEVAEYRYSKALIDAGAAGLVWDEAALDAYLLAPKAKVPGTKMAFAGLKKPEERANIIAYLKSLTGKSP